MNSMGCQMIRTCRADVDDEDGKALERSKINFILNGLNIFFPLLAHFFRPFPDFHYHSLANCTFRKKTDNLKCDPELRIGEIHTLSDA